MEVRFRDGQYQVYDIDEKGKEWVYESFNVSQYGMTIALALARVYIDGYQRGKSDWYG